MRTSTLLITLLSGLAACTAVLPQHAAAQSTCPPEAGNSRAHMVRFLTSESRAALRQQHGITGVNPANVVLLTDAADMAACQRLRSTVQPGQAGRYPTVASYYKADGFYFVSVVWVVPAGWIWTAFSPLLVFRSDFSFVESFAM
jgi:hypothetical protein